MSFALSPFATSPLAGILEAMVGSPSPSASESASPSSSPSSSPSASESPSPSLGYSLYSRGDEGVLPGDDADLATIYSAQDETDVATKDDIRVTLTTGNTVYMIHQFKNFVDGENTANLEWEGQTSVSPSISTVYLQIYNRNTTTWDTVDSDSVSSIDTDFSLIADINDLTNYKDASNVISCRVYQLAA